MYKKKFQDLESEIRMFFDENYSGFPQLLIIKGKMSPFDKEWDIKYIIEKNNLNVIQILTTVSNEESLFNVLHENNNQNLFFSAFWCPEILLKNSVKMLRNSIGWTPDGEKWDPILYKNKKLNFKGRIIVEYNYEELNKTKIINSDILRDSKVYDYSLNKEDYIERFTDDAFMEFIFKLRSKDLCRYEKYVKNYSLLKEKIKDLKEKINLNNKKVSIFNWLELINFVEDEKKFEFIFENNFMKYE